MATKTRPGRTRRRRRPLQLEANGWNPRIRAELERLITKNAGRNLPVVFDFDNTIVCGDIGEATLAMLVRSGQLKPGRVAATLSPAFRLPDGKKVTLAGSVDPTAYYDAFLAPTAHGSKDPTPLANGYAWVVEAMEGLTTLDVIEAASAAFHAGLAGRHWLEVTPGKTGFPAPFFYPEIVELIARLIEGDFDVWVVSASNVWSVRWMVARALNPRLRQMGCSRGLPPDHVVGISTLLRERDHHLYKDSVLVQDNKDYANLKPELLRNLWLTSRLHFPVPTYSGKVACVWDALGRRPWLCVGDSPGDHAMLEFSEHRLWLARLEKPAYQQTALARMQANRSERWLVQPLLATQRPGLVPSPAAVRQWLRPLPKAVRTSLRVLADVLTLEPPT